MSGGAMPAPFVAPVQSGVHTWPTPPTDDAARWEWTRLARRILYGRWESDLVTRVALQIGNVRREAWGTVDLSANLYRSCWDAIATLYDRWPAVSHSDQGAAPLLGDDGLIAASGLWPLMARVQRDTLGLREMLVRVDVARHPDGSPQLVYRPVYPDLVTCAAGADIPDRPVEVREARLRTYQGRTAWTWDVLSIADPAAPFYEIQDEDGGDITKRFLGPDANYHGAGYPYRDSAGRPVLPYVMYHAAKTGTLWDERSTLELVEGTLNLGVLYTFLVHCIRSASWPQRYVVNAIPSGMTYEDEDGNGEGRSSMVTDPATVALFEQKPGTDSQPVLGQFAAASDPHGLAETIAMYERRLVSMAGINPADQMRMSGDPRSGYAVSVSRDAQREAQRRYEPQFRQGDLELVRVSAILLNRQFGLNLPESGYRIRYEGIPKSPDEMKGDREHVMALLGEGMMDPIDAYRALNPGTVLDDAQIEARLEDYARRRQRLRVG